jgi:hypothetical protein
VPWIAFGKLKILRERTGTGCEGSSEASGMRVKTAFHMEKIPATKPYRQTA